MENATHPISGWIILDKPSGLFSRTAGARVGRILGIKKFGHIGTLDEMASGVLPIAFGNATKMIPFIENLPGADVKEYLFSMQFGFETNTLDTFGQIVSQNAIVPDTDAVHAAMMKLRGEIMQTPPAFSAVHIDGRRAYDLARHGDTPDIPPRRVVIHSLEFTGVCGPSWHFKVVCSRGTYVRALARDIAHMCGTIATVDMIRRTKTGPFQIENAKKLDFLENLDNNGADISQYLMPTDFGLADIPVAKLSHAVATGFCQGATVQNQTALPDGLVRVYDGDSFIGMGTVHGERIMPKRII